MAMPPSLAAMFGQAAASAMLAFHSAKTSARLPRQRPTPSGVPKWSRMISVSGALRASAVNSSIW